MRAIFGGFKILHFNFFFQKTENFFGGGGKKILWIYFGGHDIIGLYLEVISMHFWVFFEGQGTEWRIFIGLLKFQIFIWGA